METLNIRGIPLEVHMAGSGPPLLFLHAEQFILQARPFLDALARTHRVIAPRHPGFGTAQLPPDFRTVDDIAYLYLDLAEKLGLENAVLAGASLGGWIALEMCVRNHARFAKLALVSPVGVKLSGREERDFADIFYLPDPEAMAAAFADPARFAPSYEALPVADVEQLAREKQALAYYAWRPDRHKPGLERWLQRV
ncbi:MAG: alpha/beta fold hydrolase, partial [Hyphomicrobiaceae bacterium]